MNLKDDPHAQQGFCEAVRLRALMPVEARSSIATCLVALALALAGCAPAPAAVAPSSAPEFDPLSATTPTQSYALANGLRVVLNEDRRAPVLVVRVVYRVGWRDDPAGHRGLAHLVEHLMFHGSKHVKNLRHFEELERAGGTSIGATTGADYTNYWEQLPSDELALPLWLESDRMESGLSTLTDADLDRERHILAREYSENVENAGYGRVAAFTEAQLFPSGHAYHIDADKGEQLGEVTLAEAREFHRNYYGPNNAVLVLSGSFDSARAKAAVEHYFGRIASRPLTTPSVEPSSSGEPAPPSSSKLLVEANVLHPRVTLSWRTPALYQPGDAELDVIARHLNVELFIQRAADAPFRSGARADQASRHLASVFSVSADLPSGTDASRFIGLVEGKLSDIAQRGLDSFAVTGAAYTMLFQYCLEHDALLSRSQQLASSVSLLGDSKFLDHQSTRYRTLTGAAVQKVAAQYLKPELRVLTLVSPVRNAPIAGRLVVR
ncbi:MAG: M16 family metallopeptidase [Myxococcota bacterium]